MIYDEDTGRSVPRQREARWLRPDVAIAGGGIIGLAVAAAVAARGGRVTLMDPGTPGAASPAAAGLLLTTPRGTTGWPGFYGNSVAGYPAWLRALGKDAIQQVRIHRGGGWLTEAMPPLAVGPTRDRVAVGFDPGEAQVDPVQVLKVLRQACLQRGVRLVSAKVERITVAPRLACHAGGRVMTPGALVVACGCWSQQLLAPLGYDVGLRPQRGQMAVIPRLPQDWTLHLPDGRYVVPRRDRAIVGATATTGSWQIVPSSADRRQLLMGLPGPVLAEPVGLRPVSRDRRPLVGWLDEERRLAICAGHGKLGIGLAPLCATALAACLSGAAGDGVAADLLAAADPWRPRAVRRR